MYSNQILFLFIFVFRLTVFLTTPNSFN